MTPAETTETKMEIYGTSIAALPANPADLRDFVREATIEARALDACADYEYERGNEEEGARLQNSAIAVHRLVMAAKAKIDRNRW